MRRTAVRGGGWFSRFCLRDRGPEGLQRLGLRHGSECFRWCFGVLFSVLFCPSCSGQQTSERTCSRIDSTSGGGSPTRHGRAERQRRAARNGTKCSEGGHPS